MCACACVCGSARTEEGKGRHLVVEEQLNNAIGGVFQHKFESLGPLRRHALHRGRGEAVSFARRHFTVDARRCRQSLWQERCLNWKATRLQNGDGHFGVHARRHFIAGFNRSHGGSRTHYSRTIINRRQASNRRFLTCFLRRFLFSRRMYRKLIYIVLHAVSLKLTLPPSPW